MNTLSQFQVEPRHEHWTTAKHVPRYIRGTLNYGLRYTTSSDIQLHGFTDSDWAESAEDRKSTSRMCFSLGRKCRRQKEYFRDVFQLGQKVQKTERVLQGCVSSWAPL
jgi:hypothetical protein